MIVVVGVGITGVSVVSYLKRSGFDDILVMDSCDSPRLAGSLLNKYPDLRTCFGRIDAKMLSLADEIIVSPGIDIYKDPFMSLIKAGHSVVGDIELFARKNKKPVYAVTGSNGKSTVVSLLGHIINSCGLNAAVVGNVGIPVLDYADSEGVDCYVLEISSFQLLTTFSLCTKSAVILNITPDHLDRHTDFEDYCQAKRKVYQKCDVPVVNLDCIDVVGGVSADNVITFSNKDKRADYFIDDFNDNLYLSRSKMRLKNSKDLKIVGRHNLQNALVAIAMGEVIGLPFYNMLDAVSKFHGLSHRCELIREQNNVFWFDDSKGTNVDATKTAIGSLGVLQKNGGKIILIAGGISKGADFSVLQAVVAKHVKQIILFGKDANLIYNALSDFVKAAIVNNLEEAVFFANSVSKSHDYVLLSPACASFDMFRDFNDRGDQYKKLVEKL